MIHRFEVDPPQTTVLIYTSPERTTAGLVEFDGYVNARMVGGRNEVGELVGPCLITVDDETERGAWELACIKERIAGGKLPGVRLYEPEMGVSDDQIEALVERRVQEELRRRGYVEQPSEEALEALMATDEEDGASDLPSVGHSIDTSYPGRITMQPYQPITVQEVPATVIQVEVARDGRKRCPLDKNLYKSGTPWTTHWTRSTDPEHQRLAAVMIQPSAA